MPTEDIVLTVYRQSLFIWQTEVITDTANSWNAGTTACRHCPAPTDIVTTELLHSKLRKHWRGGEDCKSQRIKNLTLRLCFLDMTGNLDLGNLNDMAPQRRHKWFHTSYHFYRSTWVEKISLGTILDEDISSVAVQRARISLSVDEAHLIGYP